MKTFQFSGHGNYSESFGWDNGLNSSLGKEVSFQDAIEEEQAAVDYSPSFNSFTLPDRPKAGVYPYFENEHGGSRNVNGFVIAKNEKQAKNLLSEFDSRYEVIEYEG